MTKKQTTIGSDTWEWEETPELAAWIKEQAQKRLHADIRNLDRDWETNDRVSLSEVLLLTRS